jgi:hypothetical protein
VISNMKPSNESRPETLAAIQAVEQAVELARRGVGGADITAKSGRDLVTAVTGCVAVGNLEDYEHEKQFRSVANACASRTGVRITLMPGARLDYMGTTRQQFEFRKCMTDNGHPPAR